MRQICFDSFPEFVRVTQNADIHACVFPLLQICTSQSLDPQILALYRHCSCCLKGLEYPARNPTVLRIPWIPAAWHIKCDLVLAAPTSDRGTSWNCQENSAGPSCESCSAAWAEPAEAGRDRIKLLVVNDNCSLSLLQAESIQRSEIALLFHLILILLLQKSGGNSKRFSLRLHILIYATCQQLDSVWIYSIFNSRA